MWKVPKGQRMGKCHGAADEESAARAMDEESVEGQWRKKIFVEGKGWSEGPRAIIGACFLKERVEYWTWECDE